MSNEFAFYLAPMMEVTTPPFRRLMRLTSERVVLFTEMIVADAVLNMPRDRLREKIGFFDEKTVVQIGGCRPPAVAQAIAVIIAAFGFKSFNLNCGCPSNRVKKGCFGATLMLVPGTVAAIINEVERECGVVLSLKIRLGVDDHDSYEFVHEFVAAIVGATRCDTFFVHARKCWLSGLSPEQNRTRPLLNYAFVHRLKADFPTKKFVLNGGISDAAQLRERRDLDGFMVGREAVKNVFVFDAMMAFLETGDAVAVGDCREKTKTLVKRYVSLFGEADVVKNAHVAPLRNLLAGTRNCRKYKQRLSAIVGEKCVFRDFYEKIAGYLS